MAIFHTISLIRFNPEFAALQRNLVALHLDLNDQLAHYHKHEHEQKLENEKREKLGEEALAFRPFLAHADEYFPVKVKAQGLHDVKQRRDDLLVQLDCFRLEVERKHEQEGESEQGEEVLYEKGKQSRDVVENEYENCAEQSVANCDQKELVGQIKL